MQKPISVTLVTMGLVAALHGQPQVAKLTVTTASAYANYGKTVAVDGDVALVGAPDDANPANYTGAVYVFRRLATGWVQEAKLSGTNTALHSRFGSSVAIQGNLAVIGAPQHLVNTASSVYVFRHDGKKWVEETRIQRGGWCGSSVAIDGNRIAIGSMYTSLTGAKWAGAAWVFRHTNNGWVEEGKLTAKDAYYSDHLGASIAIQGTSVLVGAPYEGDNSQQQYVIGAVYHFELENGKWVEKQKFRASNFADQSYFGRALAMDRGNAIVGSPGKKPGGAAYVFKKTATGWVEQVKLRGPWPHEFGRAVTIDGDLICVASGGGDSTGRTGGAVHPYRWDGGKWFAEPPFTAHTLIKDDLFAQDVAVHKSTLLVGCWTQEKAPLSDGSAFVYDVSPHFFQAIHPLPVASSDSVKFMIRNGIPSSGTLLYFGSGRAESPLPWPGTVLLLANPLLIDVQQADKNGDATWEFKVPAAAKGLLLWSQAFQSNGVQVLSSNLIHSKVY